VVNTAFAKLLALTVDSASGDPVGPGGAITFSGPASGASTNPRVVIATTAANGAVSRVVTANGTAGSYSVTASAAGVTTPVSFTLTNATEARKTYLPLLVKNLAP
jgi:hypothetical protein